MIRSVAVTVLFGVSILVGCDKADKSAPVKENPKAAAPSQSAADKAAPPTADGSGHGGAVVELGSAKIGAFDVRASRDAGDITPGGDAPIDVRLTDSSGAAAKVAAVRFWIGTEDAKGSVKARADIENPKEPNHWHTHAEVPNPIPASVMLWVEIEDDKGAKMTGSFGLKQ